MVKEQELDVEGSPWELKNEWALEIGEIQF